MKTLGPSYSKLVAFVSVVVAAVAFVALNPLKHSPFSTAVAASEPDSESVYVIFEGPWAIVPDPSDSNSVIAIAPKTKSHRFLAVVPANAELDAGMYELGIPGRSIAGGTTVDSGILRANIEPQAVQRALDKRTERYAIRLPKPDAYVAETRFPSRVGSTYPPDASTEQNYATAVALRYSVTSKGGYQLAGTPDAGGAFKPILLDLNTSLIRFTIDPVEIHLVDDNCHPHAREAFHDVSRLVGLTSYIDFPESSADCRKKDPQVVSRSEKAQLLQGLPGDLLAGSAGGARSMQLAGMTAGSLASLKFAAQRVVRGVEAAFYFFSAGGGACRAPIIVGGP